jgi:hypothetical protein
MTLAILCAMLTGIVLGLIIAFWWFPSWLRSDPKRIGAFVSGLVRALAQLRGVEAFYVRDVRGSLVEVDAGTLALALENEAFES